VALPRNLFRISGRPDPASKFPSGSAVRIYVRIPWSLCDLALILAVAGLASAHWINGQGAGLPTLRCRTLELPNGKAKSADKKKTRRGKK
jgi:hypothetical protein